MVQSAAIKYDIPIYKAILNAINLNGALCSLFNTIFLISREKLKAMNLNGAF